jgi:PAS domain S-box-containing protein
MTDPVTTRLARSLVAPNLAVLALVLVLISGTFAVLLVTVRNYERETRSAARAERILSLSAAAERDIVDVESGLRGHRSDLDAIAALITDTNQQRRLRELRRAVDAYVEGHATADGERRLDAVRARFEDFNRAGERISLARRAQAAARGDRAILIAAVGVAGAALVLALLGLYLHRAVLQPVRRVAVAARRLANGDRDARVTGRGSGEVALLAHSFNAMADALGEREEQLRVAGDRLQGILDHASAMISVTDVDGRYLLVGRRWEEATGRTAAQVVGRTDAELVPGYAKPSRNADLEVIRTGEPVQYERDTITAKGAQSYLTVKFPLKHADGEVYAVATMSTDVSERKRALAEAVDASRSKSEFLANMSHEIRTPLNGVIGMTELLLQTELTHEQRTFVQTAASSGEALLGVIDDILDFSKIEAGKLDLDLHDVDARELVGGICAMLAPQAQRKGVELTGVVGDAVPALVRGDGVRLRQVVTNLVSNAVKFTHHGAVAVRVDALEGDRLRFEVADTGIGIAAAKLDKLFESFSQADTSTTRRYGGTGLGLAISRQLVDLMGGEIAAESVPGQGSRFHFELPVETVETAEAGPAPVVAAMPSSAAAGVRVLVAEDNPVNQLVVQTMLAKRGLVVDIAGDGEQALARLAEGDYAAVFMDCQMPNLDGYSATRRLRAEGRRLPVIAMTAHAMKGDRERCLEAGMDDYMTKPVRSEVLDEVIERWLAPAGPSAVAVEALIDEVRMQTFRDDYPDIVDQLLELFLSSTPPLLDELRTAVDAGDQDELRRTAHKLKGSCQNIGATFMVTLCRTIEGAGDDVAGTVAELDAAFASTEAAIRSALTAA